MLFSYIYLFTYAIVVTFERKVVVVSQLLNRFYFCRNTLVGNTANGQRITEVFYNTGETCYSADIAPHSPKTVSSCTLAFGFSSLA